MIKLNENYYKQLFNKYNCKNFVDLNFNIIVENYDKKNVQINLPYNEEDLYFKIINKIYEEFSKLIYKNYSDFPKIKEGEKFKKMGGKKNDIYKIHSCINNKIELINNDENKTEITLTLDQLLKNYSNINQNLQNNTLNKYIYFFKDIYNMGFTPTNFNYKNILITEKKIFDTLNNKNNIPTIYIQKSNEHQIKTIPAFEDNIFYVATNYNVCYENILLKNNKIDTLITTNTKDIPQIIQDKVKHKFKILIISNEQNIETKFNNTLLWNWKKEEIDLIKNINND